MYLKPILQKRSKLISWTGDLVTQRLGKADPINGAAKWGRSESRLPAKLDRLLSQHGGSQGPCSELFPQWETTPAMRSKQRALLCAPARLRVSARHLASTGLRGKKLFQSSSLVLSTNCVQPSSQRLWERVEPESTPLHPDSCSANLDWFFPAFGKPPLTRDPGESSIPPVAFLLAVCFSSQPDSPVVCTL